MNETRNISEIKRIPITDIAARLGISLDRHGKALCFKGHDRKPSLSVNVRGNYFKCFGCNIGGSGIDLVMEYLNVTTGEAIKWIEAQFDLKNALKRTESTGGYKYPCPAKKTPYEANRRIWEQPTSKSGKEYSDVYRHFIDSLNTDEAVKYLEERGIRRDITERAEIRIIPKDMTAVKKSLNNTYGIERLKEAGLVAEGRDGKPYFVFNFHRLIIPYHDDGFIINLQGRNIDTDSQPKYKLLSGITTTLYNVGALKNVAPGGNVYVCEGAIDALSCYQLGLEHPVAVAGVNNFRDEYYAILEPFKVIVASDKDAAGKDFYQRLKNGFLKRGKKIYALDYDRLKADYNITGEAKDLNDIARQADYNHYNGIKPRRWYDFRIGDYCCERGDGIQYDGGAYYTRAELNKLENTDDETMKTIHAIKTIFKGTLL